MTPKLPWVIAIEAGIIIVISTFFLPGGDDFYRYYLPFANGCLTCGFTPYFAQWLLWPLTLVPPALAYPLWTALSVTGFIILCRYTGSNPAVVILSFAALGEFWLGQIDIIIAVGVVLALLAKNPYWRGVGLVLAMVKPQLAGLAVLILLLQRRELLKTLAAPIVTLAASLVVFGPAWPLAWLVNSVTLPPHLWRLAAGDVWPYGLVLVLVPLAFKTLRLKVETSLLIAALATPFFSVYAYVVFLIFRAPWWVLPLSYSWLLLYPWLGPAAMRAAWIVPAGLFVYVFFQQTAPNYARAIVRTYGQ